VYGSPGRFALVGRLRLSGFIQPPPKSPVSLWQYAVQSLSEIEIAIVKGFMLPKV